MLYPTESPIFAEVTHDLTHIVLIDSQANSQRRTMPRLMTATATPKVIEVEPEEG
jgi:hypothetical protein